MGVRTFRGEGGAASQLVGLIREIGNNPELTFRLGTVLSPPPGLRIEVDGTERILEPDDVILAENLTEHTRTITVENGSLAGSTTINSQHSHGYDSLTISAAEATFSGKLSAGDRVIMFSYMTEYGPEYVVLDKAVRL